MSDYVASSSFTDLPLSEELRKGIAERGYITPTPVQAAVFGLILAGRDLICRSKTGTGKTAAFGIPLLERIPAGTRKASALVLCNTRELAQLGLRSGYLSLRVRSADESTPIEIDTPNGAATIVDPGLYRVELTEAASSTKARCNTAATSSSSAWVARRLT